MRNTLPFNFPNPVPSDMSNRFSTAERNSSASAPSGINTAVTVLLYTSEQLQ